MSAEAPNLGLTPAPAKGWRKLSPALRRAAANVACSAAMLAGVAALFTGSRMEGVWQRLPVLLALLAALGLAWFVFVRLGSRAHPVLRGAALVALGGLSLLAMTLSKASGTAALAGLLGFVAANALNGALDRGLTRGRDLKPAKPHALKPLFDNIESLSGALVMVLLVWHFGLEAFRIPSGSMSPTLSGDPVWGDRVLVDKFAYEFRDPERWEPVVFRYPLRRSDPYVKRLVALPGEEVLLAQGDIYIRPEGGEISLLAKSAAAREVLWLPMVPEVTGSKEWARFLREGEVDFKGGEIALRKRGRVVFPRSKLDKEGDVTDHDASFGDSATPKERYDRCICGDLRLRAGIELDEGGELTVAIRRDTDRYILSLKPTAGCELFHEAAGQGPAALAAPGLAALSLEAGTSYELEFSLADGVLRLAVDGSTIAEHAVGTPLLNVLRSRDKEKRLALGGPEAVKLASAEPAGGRAARIELAGGPEKGARVRVLGIERDIYYQGRFLDEKGPDLPLGVNLKAEQYFVLGDNSPGSKDCRAWFRLALFLKDGRVVSGGLDDAHQPLAFLLAEAGEDGDLPALQKLLRVCMFTPEERGDEADSDAILVKEALEALRAKAASEGKGAVDFYTEGGGYARVPLAEIERLQVEPIPYVERKLFVGRPFAVFLSPRGMKLID